MTSTIDQMIVRPPVSTGLPGRVSRNLDIQSGQPEDIPIESAYLPARFSGSVYIVGYRVDGAASEQDLAVAFESLGDMATEQAQQRPYREDTPGETQERTDLTEGLYESQVRSLAEREEDQ